MTEAILFAMIQWGMFTALIARSKHRNPAAWLAIGAALPVIALGIVIALPALERRRTITARPLAA